MNEQVIVIMSTLYEYVKVGWVKCLNVLSGLGWLKSSVGIYMLWICSHFLFANLYAHHCARWSLMGFIVSPFVAVTPYCRGILWVVTRGSDIISGMWILLGSLVTGYALQFVPSSSSKTDDVSDEKKNE